MLTLGVQVGIHIGSELWPDAVEFFLGNVGAEVDSEDEDDEEDDSDDEEIDLEKPKAKKAKNA